MHISAGFSVTRTQGQGEGKTSVLTWENGPEPVISWASGKARSVPEGSCYSETPDLIQQFAKECKNAWPSTVRTFAPSTAGNWKVLI